MNYYKKGTTLAVNRGGYSHLGIATGDGNVIHNSKEKGVIESSLLEFAKGGKIEEWSKITSENLQIAYEIAKSLIGKPYDLFSDNCEHFVNYVHGRGKKSPQIERAVITAGGAWAMADESVPSELKMIAGAATAGSWVDSEDPLGGAVKGALIGGGVILLCRFLSR